MSYSIKVTINCPMGECADCYESKFHAAGDQGMPDVDKILAFLEPMIEADKKRIDSGGDESQPPCIHGGEPTSIPTEDLERLSARIFDHWGRNSIQTNAVAILPEHIEIFKKYNFNVGVSLDGITGKTNLGRWNRYDHGNVDHAEKMTQQTLDNIGKMHNAGISLSVITVIRPWNYESLPDFISHMVDKYGIRYFRTNPGIVFDREHSDNEVKPIQLIRAFSDMMRMTINDPSLEIRPIRDVMDLMVGRFNQTCNFNRCDPYFTTGEQAINNQGILTNCLKVGMAHIGIQSMRAPERMDTRSDILRNTPQENGGCEGCKWWWTCGGNCPGEAIGNDWRNRSRFCDAWKSLFEMVYRHWKGTAPNVYCVPDFYPGKPAFEDCFRNILDGSTYQQKFRANPRIEKPEKRKQAQSQHGDSHQDEHGDVPHGDHTDDPGRVSDGKK